jgi:hypothetical protein
VREVLAEKSGKSAASQMEARGEEVEARIKRRRVVVGDSGETEKELLDKVREKARLLAVERLRREAAPEKGGKGSGKKKAKPAAKAAAAGGDAGEREAAAKLLATSAALRSSQSIEEDLAQARRLATVLEEQRLKAARFVEHFEA